MWTLIAQSSRYRMFPLFLVTFYFRKLSDSDQQNRELIGVISKKEEALYQTQVSNDYLLTENEVLMLLLFLITVCLFFAARNRPVGIRGEQCPKISQSERALYRLQTQAL